MPNIASILKQEITRIARKTLRDEIAVLKKSNAQYRTDIATLKRRALALESQVSKFVRINSQQLEASPQKTETGSTRFSAKGLRAQRQRLKLSAADCGLLLGVSAQTIYNWEAGSTRPRNHQLSALSALRGLGKTDAQAVLSQRKS